MKWRLYGLSYVKRSLEIRDNLVGTCSAGKAKKCVPNVSPLGGGLRIDEIGRFNWTPIYTLI